MLMNPVRLLISYKINKYISEAFVKMIFWSKSRCRINNKFYYWLKQMVIFMNHDMLLHMIYRVPCTSLSLLDGGTIRVVGPFFPLIKFVYLCIIFHLVKHFSLMLDMTYILQRMLKRLQVMMLLRITLNIQLCMWATLLRRQVRFCFMLLLFY